MCDFFFDFFFFFFFKSRKWHNESENFGRRWKSGDVVGCLLDIEEKTICESEMAGIRKEMLILLLHIIEWFEQCWFKSG